MRMYEQFKTNPALEQTGIELDYGDFRITIARAGGANKKYLKTLEAQTKPYRRAIQNEVMDNDRAMKIFRLVYAQTIVLNWKTRIGAEDDPESYFAEGIEPPESNPDVPLTEDQLLPVTVENIVQAFENLPDMFLDVKEQAEKSVLFRQKLQEDEAKN